MKNLKHWKVLGILLSASLAVGLLAGCQEEQTGAEGNGEYETLTIKYEGSVGTVIYPELAEDLGYLEPLNLNGLGITQAVQLRFKMPQQVKQILAVLLTERLLN